MAPPSISRSKTLFIRELDRLLALDKDNQIRLGSGKRASSGSIDVNQLRMLTEGVFFSAFRTFENYISDVFILYVMKRKNSSGITASPYLRPKNAAHAEELIRSSMQFIEWNSPDEVIRRSELYLKDGGPIKLAYTSYRSHLADMRSIRNHIAHNSSSSRTKYNTVLRRRLGTLPLRQVTPGEFLLMADRENAPNYFLITFLEHLRTVATAIA